MSRLRWRIAQMIATVLLVCGGTWSFLTARYLRPTEMDMPTALAWGAVGVGLILGFIASRKLKRTR